MGGACKSSERERERERGIKSKLMVKLNLGLKIPPIFSPFIILNINQDQIFIKILTGKKIANEIYFCSFIEKQQNINYVIRGPDSQVV